MNGNKITVRIQLVRLVDAKKIALIMLIIICACSKVMAQSTTTPAQVTVGSTYISPFRTDAYPYQSGLNPKVDYSIHFRINKGTKFTVVAVKDSSLGVIQGYVITPWNFDDKGGTKKVFYKSISDSAKKKLVALKKLQDSIKRKQDSLKILKTQLEKDSLLAVGAKDTLARTKKAWTDNADQAFRSVININAKSSLIAVPKKNLTLKNQINSFVAAQANLKTKLYTGVDPDSATKVHLIKAAMTLPLKGKDSLKKYDNKLNVTKNKLDNANQFAHDALENFNDNKKQYEEVAKSVEDLKKDAASKPKLSSSQPLNDGFKPDPNAYKINKEERNDALDIPQNPESEAALYDDLEYLDSWANGWQFFVTAKDFAQFESIYPDNHNFTWGFLTLPVKMRFDNDKGGRFDFEQNLNFGLTFGEKHQLPSSSDISLNYLAGLSVVSVPLNNATASTAATSTSAVSTSLGFMFQYEKFQIGAFLGKDFAGSHANQFAYQGKTWLGFAIGVSLFGEGKTTAATQTQTSATP